MQEAVIHVTTGYSCNHGVSWQYELHPARSHSEAWDSDGLLMRRFGSAWECAWLHIGSGHHCFAMHHFIVGCASCEPATPGCDEAKSRTATARAQGDEINMAGNYATLAIIEAPRTGAAWEAELHPQVIFHLSHEVRCNQVKLFQLAFSQVPRFVKMGAHFNP